MFGLGMTFLIQTLTVYPNLRLKPLIIVFIAFGVLLPSLAQMGWFDAALSSVFAALSPRGGTMYRAML